VDLSCQFIQETSFLSYQNNPGSIRRIFSTTLWPLVSSEGTSFPTTPTETTLLPVPSLSLLSDIGTCTIFLEAFVDVYLMGRKEGRTSGICVAAKLHYLTTSNIPFWRLVQSSSAISLVIPACL
jgi:hypothetical protein